jgi:WD40 repeat protein
LATAAGGKVGKIWDVATGQERSRFEGRTAPIHSLIFSRDGKWIATDHFDLPHSAVAEVNVWQAASGDLWASIPLTPGTPQNPLCHRPLTFSPDSRMLIVSGIWVDCPLWDVTTAPPKNLEHRIADYSDQDKSTGEAKLPPGIQLVFSPDGRYLAVPGKKPGTLTVFDAATLSPQSVLAFHGKGGWPQFSPDGRTVAVEVQYDMAAYRIGNSWQDLLSYLVARPVGQRRVSAVRLFEVDTGRALGEVPGSWWGGFTPDGQSFFTAVRTDEYAPGASLVVFRYSLPLDRPKALYVGLSALLLFMVGGLFWGGPRLYGWFLQSFRFRQPNSTTAA